MTLVMDERIKHRLIGLAVIISLGAIFAPAIMKKSSQRLEGPSSISIKLPPKPVLPQVTASDEETMFKSVKVAHVDIPTANEDYQPATTIAKAEPLSPVNGTKTIDYASAQIDNPDALKEARAQEDKADVMSNPPAELAQHNSVSYSSHAASNEDVKRVALEQKKPLASIPAAIPAKELPKTILASKSLPAAKAQAKPVAKIQQLAKAPTSKALPGKTGYSVQVALFVQQKNAIALVNKLKSKGFQASYNKVQSKNGIAYKVLVGQMNQKDQALKLRTQLASAMQINGFVVPTTGIS
ncbi:SPOR domain-containing protein [Legionella quinlivanii]|uniref:SPOR domain-containing protein n=1 Tax=Legionella quinlivanii TaxID=45073 RepID=UPI002243FC90|nr:SPOR domain-containing protein [Legionella quinlivanii]MCW8450921.1 SPOR domain-containing protein [Legionella quinlivanii]